MKKIGIFILLNIILLSSCEILEIEPNDAIEQEQVFENEAAFKSAVVGCYDALQLTGCYAGNLISIPGLLSGNLKHTGTTQEFKEFQDNNVQSNNPMIENIWASAYDGINRCNMVIANADNGVMPADEVKGYIAHAHFLRALHYFNLVRLFGDVPIKLDATTEVGNQLNVSRNEISDVYQQINMDLDFAEQHIKSIFTGSATTNTVVAFRAIVELYLNNWNTAANLAMHVIESGEYEMLGNFEDLFPPSPNDESIFDVEFNNVDNNRLAQYFLPADAVSGGRHEWEPTSNLISVFSDDDARLEVTIKDDGSTIYGGKYTEISTRSDNVYVIRLAEMYLIRAEANARLQQNDSLIRYDLQQIKLRANEMDSVFTSDYSQLLKIILNERRKEFAFEGKYWFDLVRTDSALSVLPNVASREQYLMPIPLAEIQTNPNMTQNPGY